MPTDLVTGARAGLLALIVSLALPSLAAEPATAGAELDQLFADAWAFELQADPLRASRLGDRRYNRQWPDRRPAAYRERQSAMREFLQRLYAIDRQALDETAQLNAEIFRRDYESRVALLSHRGYLIPFNQRGGVQNLDSLTNGIPLSTAGDYRDWLARLATIDAYIEQVIALAERGREAGLVAPAVLMERIPPQLEVQLVDDPADSPFFRVFAALPDDIAATERQSLQSEALATIADTVLPAYRRLDDYFNDTYLPAARDTIGLSALPDGAAWYAALARAFTTTNLTPEQIHRTGLDEVARLRGEMQTIIDKLQSDGEFDGDFAAFLEHLRTDPQFYYTTPEALLEAYRATSKRIDPGLVRLFGRLPRMPYGVEPIPNAIAPDTTTAYYTQPAADGSRAGIYWVNLYRPEVRPRYEIEVLSVHEAMPGHHLQLALQQELADLPAFRRYGGFTAFVEGWGLYSEALGYELGLYQDPYSQFGQLTYDMWRAVRLVVDTGIHHLGWSREQAIEFFRDNAAKTEHDIVNEIDRYIGMPGQALAYKIGQLKMLALRRDAELALGDDFDIRAFHDHLLGAGALPLDLLETRMDAWLRLQLDARTGAASGSGE